MEGGRSPSGKSFFPSAVDHTLPTRVAIDQISFFESVDPLFLVDSPDVKLTVIQIDAGGIAGWPDGNLLFTEGFAQEVTLAVPVEIAARSG